MTEGSEERTKLQELVLAAFQIAAQQRKPEWYRMRGSVLKNRLMDLTDRSFDEADYGADRFGDLVEQLDEMLAVDQSFVPFLVELLEPFRSEIESTGTTDGPSVPMTIRADLWRAIVDYSSGQDWIWDQSMASAIRASEAIDAREEDRLPTLDLPTLQTWREEFADEHAEGLVGRAELDVERWAGEGLGTWALPSRLRGQWNARMRERVHERLLEFFRSRDMEPPKDLLVHRRPPKTSDELRSFVMRCVAQMSDRQLKELQIPAEIAMRAGR